MLCQGSEWYRRVKQKKQNQYSYTINLGNTNNSSADLWGQHCSFVACSLWKRNNNKVGSETVRVFEGKRIMEDAPATNNSYVRYHFIFQVDIIDSNRVTGNKGTLFLHSISRTLKWKTFFLSALSLSESWWGCWSLYQLQMGKGRAHPEWYTSSLQGPMLAFSGQWLAQGFLGSEDVMVPEHLWNFVHTWSALIV